MKPKKFLKLGEVKILTVSCLMTLSSIYMLHLLDLSCVLVSKGWCNKLPQIGWLKTAESYSLIVVLIRSPKSRCKQGHAPCLVSKESFFASSSFWWLSAILGVFWLVAAQLQIVFFLVSPVSSNILLHKGHQLLDLQPTLIQCDCILTCLHL